ncbi:MAG: sporulation initiation factor Spo0A C-terminal domain-containing protein [Christensenellales bacterium]|nr:sporulation initiation factor Spo0A C-terminal domain-containing protein [Christensenellales bacterium]
MIITKKHTLYIIEPDPEYGMMLQCHFRRSQNIQLIGMAENGVVGMEDIQKQSPEIVLSEMILKHMDCLMLLKELRSLPQPPDILFQSSFASSRSLELLYKNGASYFMYRPIPLDTLETILYEHVKLSQEARAAASANTGSPRDDHYSTVLRLMYNAGFSARYSGSSYIAEAIMCAYESPTLMRNLSSGLYEIISRRNGASVSSIERSMRTAIRAANANKELQNRIGAIPTNKSCIRYFLNQLCLEK